MLIAGFAKVVSILFLALVGVWISDRNWRRFLQIQFSIFYLVLALIEKIYQTRKTVSGEMFVASLTRCFVSAKRLFRDLKNSKANSLSITPKVPFANS